MNFKNMELNELIALREELEKVIQEKRNADKKRLWDDIRQAMHKFISTYGDIEISTGFYRYYIDRNIIEKANDVGIFSMDIY